MTRKIGSVLWEIKTLPQAGGTAIQDARHTWDAGGNLTTRLDVLASQTESLAYDFLDRLTTVSNAYSQSFAYDELGNMTSKNGVSYTYSETQPHAVTAVDSADYTYDLNGNMTDRDGQAITWDVENRPISIGEETYAYDGDGNRIKKISGSVTTIYVNKYFEVSIDDEPEPDVLVETTSYYLGDRLVAQLTGEDLKYIHQDHLSGTSIMTDEDSEAVGDGIRYSPFGSTLSGSVDIDKQFTGQRLDGTGLYYYGARYYDPALGRFISADNIQPDYQCPEKLSRYSYVLNNPLKYMDPTGHMALISEDNMCPEPPIDDEENLTAMLSSLGMQVTPEILNLALAMITDMSNLDFESFSRNFGLALDVGAIVFDVVSAVGIIMVAVPGMEAFGAEVYIAGQFCSNLASVVGTEFTILNYVYGKGANERDVLHSILTTALGTCPLPQVGVAAGFTQYYYDYTGGHDWWIDLYNYLSPAK